MSAIDDLIEQDRTAAETESFICHDIAFVMDARRELAQMRERVADLEMMLRLATGTIGTAPIYNRLRREVKGPKGKTWIVWEMTIKQPDDNDGECSCFRLADDSTGLPVLTPEARAALRAGRAS